MVMGHEFAGVIRGGRAPASAVFTRVTVWSVQPLIFCGECEFCKRGLTNLCVRKKMFGVMDLNGSMATLVAAPERLLYRLPPKIDFPSAAMVEPLAVGYGAAAKANVKDRDVLIVGAGTIGLLLLQVVLAYHPRTVVVADVNDFRLGLATSPRRHGRGQLDNGKPTGRLRCGHAGAGNRALLRSGGGFLRRFSRLSPR